MGPGAAELVGGSQRTAGGWDGMGVKVSSNPSCSVMLNGPV